MNQRDMAPGIAWVIPNEYKLGIHIKGTSCVFTGFWEGGFQVQVSEEIKFKEYTFIPVGLV